MSAMPETAKRGEPEPVPCADTPVAVFYPDVDSLRFDKPNDHERNALNICASCPLAARNTCLERALARPIADQWGVIGGTTAAQRKTLIRGRQVASLIGVAA